jgi:hypothetical protein
MRSLLPLVAGLGLAAPSSSLAQAAPAGATLVLPTAEAVQGALNTLDAPNGGNSPATTYQPKVSIETATDKSTASLDVGGVFAPAGGADYLIAAFTAKAPFDSSKSDVQDLGSLSGLTAGTQAHLALTWSRWNLMPIGAITDILEFQNSPYIAQLYGYPWDRPSVPGAPTLRDAVVTLKLDPSPQSLLTDGATYKKILDELNKEIDAFNAKNAATAGFHKLAHVSAVADYSQIAADAHKAYGGIVDAYAPKWVPSLGLTLDGNDQSFTYAQASNPTKTTSESKTGAGASLVASLLHDNWLASLSYAYTHSYMAQPSSQICSPITGSTSTQCVTAAVGAPKDMTDRLITGEFRMRFSPLLAISPQVQYSTAKSDWGMQLPIYMMADKTKALNAGINLGWTTTAHFGASLFVGKPFSFK